MTEHKPEHAPTEKEAASKKKASEESEETKNTSANQKLFDDAYGKGANKARKEILESLGIDDVESAKESLEKLRDYEESQKSATEQLETYKTKNKELTSNLKEYRDRATHEATAIFDKLTEEQQKSVKDTDLPLEKLVSLMNTLVNEKPAERKNIGSPFSPNTSDESETVLAGPRRTRVDPEYTKDPQAFINKHLEEVTRKHKND